MSSRPRFREWPAVARPPGPATWLLVIAVLAVQAGVSVGGGPEKLVTLYDRLGLSRGGVARGELWQLVTYAMLHGNWVHAGANVMGLWLVAGRIEWMMGWRWMLSVVVSGVLAGGLLHLVVGGEMHLVGISGAVFAGILWICTVSPESRLWPVPLSAKNFGRGIIGASIVMLALGIWGGIGLAGDFPVSNACHVGGALAGWLSARWILRPRKTLGQLQKERRRREGAA